MSNSEQPLRFLPPNNPVQRVNPDLLAHLVAAQNNVLESQFANAAQLYAKVFNDLRLSLDVPAHLEDTTPQEASDRPLAQLMEVFVPILADADIVGPTARIHAANLAQRTHLIRAFEQPDAVLQQVTSKVEEVVRSFPHEASDIERGRNPGDVLDPYILTAAQILLYGGNFQNAIGATVAHKALMIVEGLMGHLHEDVIGMMRGNVRAPEPRGFNQELIDPHDNPFPGADIVQPPIGANDSLRFHQVKSKTGSAKGGDGKRLGDQLSRLRQYYRADVFYDALIGNTLRGHRSMRGVLNSEPEAVVLVGDAAFRELTRSKIGPELLLRVYQSAFSEAADKTGYRIEAMAAGIVSTFRARAKEAGEGYLELLLSNSIMTNPDQQDSRSFNPPSRSRPQSKS
ncbi:MAG: hypothetical protein F4149_11920 [Gammaproteobacteria bacterium]|nr:hypothetical protein [Gammaproteobacteria bacterium]MYK81516.1 hypothetical protein [Gammaproteobacteria bacterium]